MPLARAAWTSSSAMRLEAWAVIETHVVLSVGDGRQRYLNDSVARSRDRGPISPLLLPEWWARGNTVCELSAGQDRAEAARQFAMCYRFLSAGSLLATHSPLAIKQAERLISCGWMIDVSHLWKKLFVFHRCMSFHLQQKPAESNTWHFSTLSSDNDLAFRGVSKGKIFHVQLW